MCIGACAKPLKWDSPHLYGLQWELARTECTWTNRFTPLLDVLEEGAFHVWKVYLKEF